jgi:hypothetical protein
LAERRLRGDLIEVFKAKHNISRINGVFKFGRSGNNLTSSVNICDSNRVRKIKRNFINDRVKNYWNKLPIEIRNCTSVDNFKSSLGSFRSKLVSTGNVSGQFWEVSYQVLDKIESDSYLINKESHNNYLRSNPFVAKRKGINIGHIKGS